MKSTAELECDCTVKTNFDYIRPVMGKPVVQNVACRNCKAVWAAGFRKTLTGGVVFKLQLVKSSQKLDEFYAKKKARELSNAPQKKAPVFYVPGSSK